jgi:hypothetical protein
VRKSSRPEDHAFIPDHGPENWRGFAEVLSFADKEDPNIFRWFRVANVTFKTPPFAKRFARLVRVAHPA